MRHLLLKELEVRYMQALDAQNDMQPINYTEAIQSSNPEKKQGKTPDRKGASFLDMIRNLMTEESEPHTVGKKDAAGKGIPIENDATPKNAASAQVEFFRLTKGGTQKNSTPLPQFEADMPEAQNTVASLDAELLLTSEEGIDIKNILEPEDADKRQNLLHAQMEEIMPEEALAFTAEEGPHAKKRNTGKSEIGLTSAGTQASALTATPDKQSKTAEESIEQDGLEKSVKSLQVRQQKPVFTVIDERTATTAPVATNTSVHEAGAAVRTVNAPSVDMALDFRNVSVGFGSATEGAQTAKESGAQSFASLVAQQVQDMAPDFVQAGRIVLQDNNAGIIRLQMQPAHLGNVRINLELAGNKKIVGKIITGSKEAYEAFKESIEQLAQAFEQGGFASAQFDVSWSGEGSGRQFGESNSQSNELFTQNDRLEVIQDNRYADTETVYAFGQDQAVNVFA